VALRENGDRNGMWDSVFRMEVGRQIAAPTRYDAG